MWYAKTACICGFGWNCRMKTFSHNQKADQGRGGACIGDICGDVRKS